MAVVLEKKNGGPYTKKDKEKRQNDVYTLHFEKGYSAVRIAEMLGVNRNTINEDIKHLYVQAVEELPTHTSILLLKQIQRLEFQRNRLLNELERKLEFKEKIMVEKLLFAVDEKITFHLNKMAFHSWDIFHKARENKLHF